MVRTFWLMWMVLAAVPASAQDVRRVKRYVGQVKKHLKDSYLYAKDVDREKLEPAGTRAIHDALGTRTAFPGLDAGQRDVLRDVVDAYKDDLKQTLEAIDVAREEMGLELDLFAVADVAANGMIAEAGDPYGRVMTFEDIQKLQKMLSGQRSNTSMGISIRPQDGKPTIRFLYYGFAGERAGLQVGDAIVEIDDTPVGGLEQSEIRERLSMKERERIALTIQRPGFAAPVKIEVRRPERIPKQVLHGLIGDGIGYLRLTIFDTRATRAVRRALKDLRRQKIRGLVFDLRNNPGGDMRVANAIADEFVEAGKTITRVEWSYRPLGGLRIPGLMPPDEYVTTNRREGVGEGLPMVTLINGNSASASELVAGAFRDLGRSTFVGEPTYGKGVGQSIIPLGGLFSMNRESRFLYLTILRFKLPLGGNVPKGGLAPDVMAPARTFSEAEFRTLTALRRSRVVGRYVRELFDGDSRRAETLADYDDFDTAGYPEFNALLTRIRSDLPAATLRELLRMEVRRRLRARVASKREALWPYDLQRDEPLQRALMVLLDRLPQDSAAPAEKIDSADMRRMVEWLAADEMKGRRAGSEECFKAAAYIVDRFKALGLKAAGDDGYYQRNGKKFANVMAVLEGSDPELKKQCIVIGAHHDGQGMRGERVRNSADDNASGVAMMLELAEAFCALPEPPKRSILFQSYDAEERGMVGSQYFTDSKLFEAREVVAMICLDLVGGDFTPWEENRIYAMGSESSPQLRRILQEHVARERSVDVAPVGVYIIEPMGPGILGARSDYASFRAKEIPYIFFSTGTPWYYHTTEDDPERLDYAKMQKAGRFIYRLMRELADSDERYEFVLGPTPAPSDAALVSAGLTGLLGLAEAYDLDEEALASIRENRDALARIAKQKSVSRKELRQIQRAMRQIFSYAKLRPRKD